LEELEELRRTQKDYCKCGIVCFTEKWLQDHIPDSNAFLLALRKYKPTETIGAAANAKVEVSQCLLTTDGVILNMSL